MMTAFLTELRVGQNVMPISREPVPLDPLIFQLKASGFSGELRIVDEETGEIKFRFQLNQDPEEGDCHQPLPA
jgi:hypothetical protein